MTPAVPATPTDADRRHHGWHMRRHFWTPETRAKVDPLLRANARMAGYAARQAKRRFPGADYDDLLSEAMYALARCAATYDPDGGASFATYAIRTVCRTVRDRAMQRTNARRRPRGVRTVAMMPHDGATRGGILDDLADAEDAAWVRAWIGRLPPPERRVMELRAAGARYNAIARDPGVNVSASHARLIYSRVVRRMGTAWRAREAG